MLNSDKLNIARLLIESQEVMIHLNIGRFLISTEKIKDMSIELAKRSGHYLMLYFVRYILLSLSGIFSLDIFCPAFCPGISCPDILCPGMF